MKVLINEYDSFAGNNIEIEKFHENKEKNTYHIYDKIFKRILTLSKRAVIHLINGLFQQNYPPDSIVEYNWTEHVDKDLRRTIADTIITINHTDSYHLEAQMYQDEQIVLRMFEYGYHHSMRSRQFQDTIIFPEPVIIYLADNYEKIPDYYLLNIEFKGQGEFSYKVPTIKYLSEQLEELNRNKMIILIPFQLLRLRKALKKERSNENIEALKKLIKTDIIGSIIENEKLGNITKDDARRLKRLTLQLYHHIYDRYEELEERGVSEMVEEALVLDIDIIEYENNKKLEELKEKLEKEKQEEITQITEQKNKELKAMRLLLEQKSKDEIKKETGLTDEQLMALLKGE
ncbi:hypothetical protein [uncultured Robinsoniella sp.]|uniref:hypothetical protein n=1 Tax=uncultured Robinsoniella sp. TaxID=904190 RepID=UPI00374E7374